MNAHAKMLTEGSPMTGAERLISRHFTTPGSYQAHPYVKVDASIRRGDGTFAFQMPEVEVPANFSKKAADILAQKYCRRAGVPLHVVKVPEPGVPEWLWSSQPAPGTEFAGETSARQIFHRLAGCWTYWGWKLGYFADEEDARAFYEECFETLQQQMVAPNSPQWFNTGLHWAYGIDGPAQGHWFGVDLRDPANRLDLPEGVAATDEDGVAVAPASSSYARPQPHACFIQGVSDDLVNEGGIMDLWNREARLFKFGSGTGSNFSNLRASGEKLSGGGTSSGLMSFLKIGDAAAGSIKSGGTTRRAAKMVVLNVDHPDIEQFITWKSREERKVAYLVAGSKMVGPALKAIHEAASKDPDPAEHRELRLAMRKAKKLGIPEAAIDAARRWAEEGHKTLPLEEYDASWEGEAYQTVSGQNANNSVRLSDDFMSAVREGRDWDLTARTTGKPLKTVRAPYIWDLIAKAAWQSADPGLQFDDAYNDWHTCPVDGRINATNPCVTGDTLVATKDGWQRIDALLDNPNMVIGSDGGLHTISPAFKTGRRPIYKLTTQLGLTLRLTGDHKVLTYNRGDVPALELRPEDRIAINLGAYPDLPGAHALMWGRTEDRLASLEPAGVEDVYDLTEPATHHFVANGIVVHNCSEYAFLDATACNLASSNLIKFRTADGLFDVPGFMALCALWTIVLDISVSMAAYPYREMALRSLKYRTLGLGYANLGGLLMASGIAYDSDNGRSYAAAITALMHGVANQTSIRLARVLGPFPAYARNAEPMTKVMEMHRRAAHGESWTTKGRKTFGLNATAGTPAAAVAEAARTTWDGVLADGPRYGWRNAQVTVIAPTGTIGMVMDCDTTGIEPDFALVKFKTLAGGGYMKIVNETVPVALRNLGYSEDAIRRVEIHALGHGSFDNCPVRLPSNVLAPLDARAADLPHRLEALGYSSEDQDEILNYASAHGTLQGCRVVDPSDAWGISPETPGLRKALIRRGVEPAAAAAVAIHAQGHGTIEGAPDIHPDHLAIFDCANTCGDGSRALSAESHVLMMAACQPFLSGSISKTVNMPRSATVGDIASIHWLAWETGVKAIAIYRDGSKLSQPLNLTLDGEDDDDEPLGQDGDRLYTQAQFENAVEEATKRISDQLRAEQAKLGRGSKERLPSRVRSYRSKGEVGNFKLYMHVGEYPDGRPGEMFLSTGKDGSAFRSLLNAFAISVSTGLQHGVPLNEYVDAFTFTKFEPAGPVRGHDRIKNATSILDFIFRELAITYLNREDLAHVPAPNAPTDAVDQAQKGSSRTNIGATMPTTAALVARDVAADAVRSRSKQRLSGRKSDAEIARERGYTGDLCDACQHYTMVRNGTCLKCDNCGNTTGCS